MRRAAIGLCLLQAADLVTTWRAVGAGAVEGHPVGRFVMGEGWLHLIGFKVACTAVFVALIAYAWRRGGSDRTAAMVTIQSVCVLMLGVVAWNTWIAWLLQP